MCSPHFVKAAETICGVFGGMLIEYKNLQSISKNETPTVLG
jgi:hypothetical protein